MNSPHDPELVALQERWSPAWSIWRARGSRDPATMLTLPGSYCASRMDDGAGITPFLMSRSPVALHVALEAQAAAVETGATSAPEPGVMS
jgi:hypothetical protein